MSTPINIYEAFKALEENNVILSFKGSISDDLLSAVYRIIEQKLDIIETDSKTRKKVYNIMVECLQNIFHHMEKLKTEDNSYEHDGMFMFEYDKISKYYIHTGNFIRNANSELLQQRLEKVNAMFPEELRAHYVETLGTTELSEKGGAGLGIIDMARKSGNKLAYNFNRISDELSFFSLTVCINR